MTDPVIRDAIKLRDGLLDVAKELRMRRDGNPELKAMDAETCEKSAAMLEKLGTEVTRLRLGAQHLLDGRLDRRQMRRMVETWNDSPADQPED